MSRRQRRRRRRLKGRKTSRDAQPERFVDVRVERSSGSRRRSAKVTKVRRSSGGVTEERYEL